MSNLLIKKMPDISEASRSNHQKLKKKESMEKKRGELTAELNFKKVRSIKYDLVCVKKKIETAVVLRLTIFLKKKKSKDCAYFRKVEKHRNNISGL